MPELIVFTTDPCSFCTRTKDLLKARGHEYEEINLAKDPEGRAELARRTGMLSFPQVLIDGALLGGFQETLAADQSGRLNDLLAA